MTLNYFVTAHSKLADGHNQTQINHNSRNVIKVLASGEVSLIPDMIHAWIVLTARKDTPGLCRSSIEKRANYLRKCFKSLKIELTWRVLLPNFEVWQRARDVISEKIDHVTISKPDFGYLPKTIEKARDFLALEPGFCSSKARRSAYLKAVELGKDKAKIAAEVVNMMVKHAISIEELECDERMILEAGNPDDYSDDDDGCGGDVCGHGDNGGSVLRRLTGGKNSGLKLMNLNLASKLCLSFELMDRC
ncbi:hypothetical protein HELRODRAFT_179754 [Helobdella robusta]|uniref:Uncharacterized protein n=1 Tax=Helobdella robusta TaxID=6412 RepID=T1FF44_HELRO|nr:hypothetical protein HELRODRAFT_179754 [Helobdella robusta]ESN95156.1 hypothetical protein HELRODRAFT_179754 [Helobdella robusta]